MGSRAPNTTIAPIQIAPLYKSNFSLNLKAFRKDDHSKSQRDNDQKPIGQDLDVDIGKAGTESGSLGRIQQFIYFQMKTPGQKYNKDSRPGK